MRPFKAIVAFSAIVTASLTDICTVSSIQKALPSNILPGLTIDPSSLTTSVNTNSTVSSNDYPTAIIDYCAVTFAYSHAGLNDSVLVQYWLPAPDDFKNRYLSTGGGGYAINSGNRSLPAGVQYGAVSGMTDGGFGSFDTQFDAVSLLANGTLNWPAVYMFGYQAHHELTLIGKTFARNVYGMEDNTKLYAYYQGCSEGGREGWSQLQRYPEEWDGAITGAPAFRFSHQQVQHLYSNVVEKTVDYYPSPCEFEKIVNETIAACDALDGRIDGVVARTDLCKLHFDSSSIVGKNYSCPVSTSSLKRQMSVSMPAQSGTVSAKAVEVAQTIIDGLKDSQGRQAYFSYQPAASFEDGQTAYNTETEQWELSISSFGSEFVQRFLNLVNSSSLPTLDNVTYDTLRDWMYTGWQKYEDSLQTTRPDLSTLQAAGVKVLHYHGESDNSIPTASSVHYHESVRRIMYPHLSFNESSGAMGDWYRLFLVPGGAHCSPNTAEPNGPWPQTNLGVMIDWVENGVKPVTLNGTVLDGEMKGANQQICAWPLRPIWENGKMECVYHQPSIDSWLYSLDSFNMPVY
ncbi:hypothetical protein MW887_003218 [Aspergillus wentii]|nr:hypothetical protein MW887_003218 [Aspergillus wentii]